MGIAVSPVLESFIAIVIYNILTVILPKLSATKLSIVVGCIAGLLHAFVAPLWALPVSWSFFVYVLGWRNWVSENRQRGWAILASPHIIQNALGYLLFWVFR